MGLILFVQAIGIDLYVLSVLSGGSTYHSETYIDCKTSPCCVWYVQTRHLLQPELVLEDVSQDHARKTVCYTLNSYDILEQCHTSTHLYLYWGSKLRVVYWSRIVLIFSEVHIDKGGKGSLRYILRFCICR
jgi:hypothetical protein